MDFHVWEMFYITVLMVLAAEGGIPEYFVDDLGQ